MVNDMQEPAVIDRLEKLGFKKASAEVKELSMRKRKMALAYELYRFVRPEKITDFRNKLYKETHKTNGSYQTLEFQPIEDYKNVPPGYVLDALEKATEHKCFDNFEVAYIREVADPLLFGRIDGCPDMFFLAQWDTDVKIEDILAPNEG